MYASMHEVRRDPKTGKQQQRFYVSGKWTKWQDVTPDAPLMPVIDLDDVRFPDLESDAS